MNALSTDINSCIENECQNKINSSKHNITIGEVRDAIHKLKQGKKEENGLFSNHFKNGSDRLIIMITLLFNSMIIHGIAPDELILGTMIPLIKDNRGKNNVLKIIEPLLLELDYPNY